MRQYQNLHIESRKLALYGRDTNECVSYLLMPRYANVTQIMLEMAAGLTTYNRTTIEIGLCDVYH